MQFIFGLAQKKIRFPKELCSSLWITSTVPYLHATNVTELPASKHQAWSLMIEVRTAFLFLSRRRFGGDVDKKQIKESNHFRRNKTIKKMTER